MATVVSKDVTEQKLAKQKVLRSREELRNLALHLQNVREEERTEVAREIHDDLGQLLVAIRLNMDLLDGELPKDKRAYSDIMNSIDNQIEAALDSTDLLYKRLRPSILEEIGLGAAVSNECTQIERQHKISCEYNQNFREINLGKDRSLAIFRIAQEAFTNVTRHAEATEVKASLLRKEGKLELTVEDNGKGITKENLFSPYSFGLLGMRERVGFLGGEIKISPIMGGGTKVFVSVPLSMVKEKSGIKIIIADDHAFVREGLKKVIDKAHDIEIIDEASDGKEALEKALDVKCDVLVLDISMPKKSGFEVLKELKKKRPEIRVLILSVQPERDSGPIAERAGADGYLTKSESPKKLIEAIRKIHKGEKYFSSSRS